MILIIVPIVLSLLLNLNPVQNYVIGVITGSLSKKAGTTISVDHVSLRLFNRVALDGLYVEDYHGDTLLYARNLIVPIHSFGMQDGKISLGAVELKEPSFYLMQDSTGITNLKQILAKFKRQKPKKKKRVFRLNATSLNITDMKFKHRKLAYVPKEYGVNFTDIDVEHFNFKGNDIKIINDSVMVDIDNISLVEKSGLEISSLSTRHFMISGSGMRFQKLDLQTPQSHVDMNYLTFDYGSRWKGLKNFIQDVKLEAEIVNSTVAFPTIAYFAQSLREWKSVYTGFSGTYSGTVADMKVHIDDVMIKDTKLKGNVDITGLPDIKKTRFNADIVELSTNSADAEFIYNDITHKMLDTAVVNYMERMGNIIVSGQFNGLLTDFNALGTLTGQQGKLDLDFAMKPDKNNKPGFKGKIETHGFDVGSLLETKKLGHMTLYADVEGVAEKDNFSLNTTAVVPALFFNGYRYHDIDIGGTFHDKMFKGAISSADTNIDFRFDGTVDFQDSLPSYKFDLDLRNADLHKLNVNKRDSVSLIKCMVAAEGSGLNLDNINGNINIDSMVYINHIDTVRTGEIRFIANNNDSNKLLGMYSSFADVEFKGQLSYNDMISYLTNTLVTYLPSMSTRKGVEKQLSKDTGRDASRETASVSSYYIVTVNVKEANNVAGIFMPGLQLAEGSQLSFLFNPQEDRFSINMNADFIERGKFFVSNLDVTSRNESDSISLFIRADDLYVGNMYMPNFSVVGGAKNNRINVATRFNNTENGTYAMLSTTSLLYTNEETGVPQVRIDFYPSTFTADNQTWNIGSRGGIIIDSSQIAINRFRITGGEQELLVNGIASRNRSDTLHVQLNRFDLAPFSKITRGKGYDIAGTTSGHADIMSALQDALISSDITFDSVSVNDIKMPNTTFRSNWDFHSEQARLYLTDTNNQDTIAYGFYRPTDRRYLINADFDSINMALLNPFLSGVLRETQGVAQANLVLTNPNHKMQLNGKLKIPYFSTIVDYTNVKYVMQNGTGEINNNNLVIHPAILNDPIGNGAGFEMSMNMNTLSNITYEVKVRPTNTLVMNTTIKDNELFYGTVFASGAATITGDKRGVNMNIVASTDNNSRFYMPLGGSATASTADFIEFRDTDKIQIDSLDYRSRRKRMLEERLKKRQVETSADMDIKMLLTVLPNTEMQIMMDPEMDNVIRGRGNGSINVNVNPKNNVFTIYGDYEITEGSYKFSLQNNLLSKMFIIQPGSSMQWTGDPVDAMLNITAKYNVKASLAPLLSNYGQNYRSSVPVECLIRLTERLTQPDISFDVQVPNTDAETRSLIANALNTQEMMATQFLWLLAANSFFPENQGATQNLNIGAMASTVTGIEFLSNQLSRILSTERFSLVPKYRPRSDVTSDEIGLAFSAELIKDRLTIDVDGNYDMGNNISMTNRTANTITGDVYVNWLLDPMGNIKAKAFTRTIDRFDENQGLQESGIGISYKEDFDNVKDLWEKIKYRFTGKKKKNKSSKSDK